MTQGLIIVGAQWGDEGKGKIVDLYSQRAQIVARFQGGNNAGHTLYVGDQKLILHLIPSGILHPHTLCYIGPGVVCDPEVLEKEMAALTASSVPNIATRVRLSPLTHLILDYHRAVDAAREQGSDSIGTTKRGIGPAYEDRVGRRGVRVCDLMGDQFEKTAERIRRQVQEKNALLTHVWGKPVLDADAQIEKCRHFARFLEPLVSASTFWLQHELKKGTRIIYEGAQGILLDLDFGTYPFVTSSHTLPGQGAIGLGCPLPQPTAVLGVLKAYATRVGDGPFPTELTNSDGDNLRKWGSEFGATTGRPRRCGWLDLVALRYAVRVGGITHLAITKADILSQAQEVQVCTAYRYRGSEMNENDFPLCSDTLDEVDPVYRTFPSWPALGASLSDGPFQSLPHTLQAYLAFIEDFVEVPVAVVSMGPGRAQVVERIRLL